MFDLFNNLKCFVTDDAVVSNVNTQGGRGLFATVVDYRHVGSSLRLPPYIRFSERSVRKITDSVLPIWQFMDGLATSDTVGTAGRNRSLVEPGTGTAPRCPGAAGPPPNGAAAAPGHAVN
jgi:hypothetical protein